MKNQAIQAAPPTESEKTEYVEVTIPTLTERGATALVNSIRYPGKPNDKLKESMRKHWARS